MLRSFEVFRDPTFLIEVKTIFAPHKIVLEYAAAHLSAMDHKDDGLLWRLWKSKARLQISNECSCQ